MSFRSGAYPRHGVFHRSDTVADGRRMMMMLSKLLQGRVFALLSAVRRSVLVSRQAVRAPVQLQLRCRMEAVLVAAVVHCKKLL